MDCRIVEKWDGWRDGGNGWMEEWVIGIGWVGGLME